MMMDSLQLSRFRLCLVASLASLITWGLGLVVGVLLAKEVAAQGRQRGLRLHFPMLVAAGYSGYVIWHMGYSGSGTLTAATGIDAIVTPSADNDPKVLSWGGSKFPMSTSLADRVRAMIEDRDHWRVLPPDVQEWLELQDEKSAIPDAAAGRSLLSPSR